MSREYTRRISVLGQVPSHGPFTFYDDFEGILKWTKNIGAGDSIFELDPTIANSGNQSLHMKTRTTGAAEDDTIGAIIHTHMLPSKKLNQSVLIRSPDFTKIKSIEYYFDLFNIPLHHFAQILFFPNTAKFQYTDHNNVLQDIPDTDRKPAPNAWHRIQLLADFNSDKYISLIFDSHFHDLSQFEIHNPGYTIHTFFESFINITTIGAAPCELYIDDFLIHEL